MNSGISKMGHATIYPEREMHSSDFKVLTNQKIVAKLRLRLIRMATRIDVIDYDLGGDPTLAIPFYEALRYAADRGARVRVIRGGYVSKLYRKFYREPSWDDIVEKYLAPASTSNPIQYVFFGGWRMMAKGWSLFAGVHEKLVIAYLKDGAVVFMPGHGLSHEYFKFRDHCTIFKGTGKNDLVADAQDAFNRLWKTVHEETWRDLPNISDEPTEVFGPQNNFTHDPSLPLDTDEKHLLKKLKGWAGRPPVGPLPARRQDEDLLRVKFIHHNLLDQLREKCATPWVYGYTKCTDQIEDPIIGTLIQLLQTATSFRLYTLGLTLPPDLKTALLARLEEAQKRKTTGDLQFRDFKLEIFTNGEDAYKAFVFWPLSRVAWKTSLQDIDDLLRFQEQGDGRGVDVKIYAFEKSPQNDLIYLHAKGAIATLPNGEVVATTGSHNSGTRTSSKIDDEMNVLVLSTPTAQIYDRLFSEGVAANGRELRAQEIARERWWNRLPLWGWETCTWRWMLDIVGSLL